MSKIVSTNFSTQQLFDLRKLRLYMSVVFLVLLVTLLYLVDLIYELDGNIVNEKKTRDVLQYEYSVVKRAAESIPNYSTLKEIERKVNVVKDIAGTKGDTAVKVLGEIEKILPKDAALSSFYHKSKIGEIDITVSANDTLSLTAFVHALEKSERFNQVLITRQSHQEQESDTISYDIRIIQ